LAEETPKLGQVATATGQVGQHEDRSEGTLLARLAGSLRSLVVHGVVASQSGVLTSSDLGGALRARGAIAARLLGCLALFFSRYDNEIGRTDAMLVGPGHFLSIGVTAAVVPTLFRRRAAARVVLAREGPRTVFLDARDDSNPGRFHEEGQNQQNRKESLRASCRDSSEPPAHINRFDFVAGRNRLCRSVVKLQVSE
jgi:hypothetical protein